MARLSHIPNRDHCVAHVVQLLVEGRYEELAALSQGVRMTATDLESAVASYGRPLVLPPSNARYRFIVSVELAYLERRIALQGNKAKADRVPGAVDGSTANERLQSTV